MSCFDLSTPQHLPGYRLIDAVDQPSGGRRVKVQPLSRSNPPTRGFG
jgi:hypothetical protein